MFPIRLTRFGGEMPRVDAALLPENMAQAARNVDLSSGTLRGRHGVAPSPVASIAANIRSIYRYNPSANGGNGFWFTSSAARDFARGPIAEDPYLRTYFGGADIAPRVTTNTIATQGDGPYPSAWYTLGVPAPATAPTASAPSGTAPTGSTPYTSAYVVTYVTALGEEGPPSLPSNTINRWDGSSNGIVFGDSVPGSRNIVSRRVYRTDGSGDFLLHSEHAIATVIVPDTLAREALGLPLETTTFDPPPTGMQGFVVMPNGVMAGFKDNTLYFSEPYLPYAWPVDYRLALQYEIVGIAAAAAGLVVMTKGRPSLVVGQHPSSFQQVDIDETRPCLSKRGIVDMGDYVVYPSRDGLVAIGNTDAPVITAQHLTADQWQALNPASMHAYRAGDDLLCFHDGGAFLFNPATGYLPLDATADAAYVDDATGAIYIKTGTEIREWNSIAAARIAYRWRSKPFIKPRRVLYRWAKVTAITYPVRIRLFYDGVAVFSQLITSDTPVRVPRLRAQTVAVEIEADGNCEVRGVQLVSNTEELI